MVPSIGFVTPYYVFQRLRLMPPTQNLAGLFGFHLGYVRAPSWLHLHSDRTPSGLRPGAVWAPSGCRLSFAGRAQPGWVVPAGAPF